MHMYNRYIPQPDGTYTRSRIPDKSRPPKPQPPKPSPCPPVQETCPPPIPEPCPSQNTPPCPPQKEPMCKTPEGRSSGGSIGGFLRQLLPKDFDTGDLLIVLLLLLMAGDCAEEQNTALLTLALYMFM